MGERRLWERQDEVEEGSRTEARNAAIDCVRFGGWYALQWPLVRRYFPAWMRWAAELVVAGAIFQGLLAWRERA